MSSLPENTLPVESRLSWHDAVMQCSDRARLALSTDLHSRLERATALVLHKQVWFEDDGETCQVQASDHKSWYVVNHVCGCDDFQRAPSAHCKHRIARRLYERTVELLQNPTLPEPDGLDGPEPAGLSTIPAQYLKLIHGRPFVLYSGLLAMAHERGLQSLTARFLTVTPDLATAEATAVFTNGTSFTEAADATPGNVGATIRPHFARMALTRAKARALRDGLNIASCSAEEVE